MIINFLFSFMIVLNKFFQSLDLDFSPFKEFKLSFSLKALFNNLRAFTFKVVYKH